MLLRPWSTLEWSSRCNKGRRERAVVSSSFVLLPYVRIQAIDGRQWSDRWPPVSVPLDAAIRLKVVRHADCIDLQSRARSRAFKNGRR